MKLICSRNQAAKVVCLFVLVMTLAATAAARETAGYAQKTSAQTTPEQKEWLDASPEQRRTLGEQIGERGGRDLARKMGLEPLFDGAQGKGIAQGPDQVYRAKDGAIHVFETKANSSPLNTGYGYTQGSVEHTLKSAEKVLRSPKASEAQKRAAKAILRAATEAKLKVSVVQTRHILGKVTGTGIIKEAVCGPQHIEIAKKIIEALANTGINIQEPASAIKTAMNAAPIKTKSANAARNTSRAGAGKTNMVKGVAKKTTKVISRSSVIGIGVDAAVRGYRVYSIEQAYANGQMSDNQRIVAHGENVAGCVGGWTGAATGAKGGALVGAAIGSFFGPIGTGVGSVAGGISGAVGGYMAGDALGSASARAVLEE